MNKLLPLILALILAACATKGIPPPHHLPAVTQTETRWFKLSELSGQGEPLQTTLLAVQPEQDNSWRWLQTDALGAPKARLRLDKNGWQNDGFIMPNPSAQQLFAAMLPLLLGDAANIYPDLNIEQPGSDTVYRRGGQTVWTQRRLGSQYLLIFPNRRVWQVESIAP